MIDSVHARLTHRARVEKLLRSEPSICDDCIAVKLGISKRQNVRSICSKNRRISARTGSCNGCKRKKLVRFLAVDPALETSRLKSYTKSRVKSSNYHRERHLRDRFNKSIEATLGIAPKDYYGRLTFANLLGLKATYARIHDIITVRLAFTLVQRIARRLNLCPNQSVAMINAIDATHPNASGFDLDSQEPNIIGEVKGCIPMNDGDFFGAAQTKGLTNDVLQMLGQPPLKRKKEELSQNSKIHRPQRAEALKFLGLYDSPKVRGATESWRVNLLRSKEWTWGSGAILHLPETGELSNDSVYVVYLRPESA